MHSLIDKSWVLAAFREGVPGVAAGASASKHIYIYVYIYTHGINTCIEIGQDCLAQDSEVWVYNAFQTHSGFFGGGGGGVWFLRVMPVHSHMSYCLNS